MTGGPTELTHLLVRHQTRGGDGTARENMELLINVSVRFDKLCKSLTKRRSCAIVLLLCEVVADPWWHIKRDFMLVC